MCLRPIELRPDNIAKRAIRVPCGKCALCLRRRSSQWAYRLEQELRVHPSSLFITLTYDPQHLPLNEGGVPTLNKGDLQRFFKRLRFNTKKHIKYYACGEYGSLTGRPHYHAIVFNVTPDDVNLAWSVRGESIGQTYFGATGSASIRYVTGYICKSYGRVFRPDVEAEFSLMSKGLGKSYLTPAVINWHKQNAANYVVLRGGAKHTLPRYYKDRIFTEEERASFVQEYLLRDAKKTNDRFVSLGRDEFVRVFSLERDAVQRSFVLNSNKRFKI